MASSSTGDLKSFLTVFTYGPDQKRTEIELRPTIPADARGQPVKIDAWAQALTMSIAPDFKYTNEWGCEICGKPARESKYDVVSWVHLDQPRIVIYIHHLCTAGQNMCHTVIKQQAQSIAAMAGTPVRVPLPAELDSVPASVVFPLASSCAFCNEEDAVKKGVKMSRCGGCKLTRYCCPGCQRADWPRHKKACKIIESVKWVHWSGMPGSSSNKS